jgi:hypothetical protein
MLGPACGHPYEQFNRAETAKTLGVTMPHPSKAIGATPGRDLRVAPNSNVAQNLRLPEGVKPIFT